MSKLTTTVAALIFLGASFFLSPNHDSNGTAAQRARAVHIARSAR